MNGEFAAVTDVDAAIDRVDAHVRAASGAVVLAVPSSVFATLRPALVDARERGALVVALVGTAADVAVDDATSVCREWAVAESGIAVGAFDGETAMVAAPGFLGGDRDGRAVFVDDPFFEDLAFSSFFGNFWPVARHVHTSDPVDLPRTFTDFRHATVQAALRLRDGEDLTATAWTMPPDAQGRRDVPDPDDLDDDTVSGRVLNVRQSVVQPVTSSFPLENSLELETTTGHKSVGGPGAFVEDHAAGRVRLSLRDRD
jgi:hypothetical protein